MADGRNEALAQWFHREMGERCIHPNNTRATCEAWADQFMRTGRPLLSQHHSTLVHRDVADAMAESAREAARAEGMAAVAGPVLALAEYIDQHAATPECGDDNGYRCQECTTAAAIRDEIPTDAEEALARLKAQWQAEALRDAASRMTEGAADPYMWDHAAFWLRAHADRIDRGGDS